MFTRFSWLLGGLTLLSIGLFVACGGSHFSASSDGLVLVPTQGQAELQSFSFDLSNGHTSTISNPPAANGVPTSVVIDPAGTFAYVIVNANAAIDGSTTGIGVFAINSNGTTTSVGTTADVFKLGGDTTIPASPTALVMDPSGKYLFVAEGIASGSINLEADLIHVFSIGGSGSLTLLTNAFALPMTAVSPNFVALATTPLSFPTTTAACSTAGFPAPTREFLYAADSANDRVWEFEIDMSSGTVGNPGALLTAQYSPTGSVPSGVAVDGCNRFVYVANKNSNTVSAYTMCNGTATSSQTCTDADGGLVGITGSPFTAGNTPGPIALDPFANFVFVLAEGSFQISSYRISQITGELTPLSPATTATGSAPRSIAVRSDGNWVFVANYGSATVSQYALTPASGVLVPQTPITTDNNPWGVAVK